MPRLPPQEIDEYLRKPYLCHLATIRPDGSPHVAPVWHHYDGAKLMVLAEPHSVKISNIRHDPRVSASIPTKSAPNGYVQVNGTATISSEWDRELLWAMSINYQGREEGERYAATTVRESEFLLITVTPTKMHGWLFP